MGRSMSEAEIREFMASGSRTGKLATVRKDSSPHVVPIWFDFDGNGDAVFLTRTDSLEARNLRRDPRVSIARSVGDDPAWWASSASPTERGR